MVQTITRREIAERLHGTDKLVLVEALPPRYYEAEHLPGALNIPHDRVEELAPTLLPDKNATIVTYCSNAQCPNSRIAAQVLERLGYNQVYKYEAGKQDWIAAGLPTEGARRSSAA